VYVSFALGLLFTLCIPPLIPSLKLFYFIPFLIRCIYLKKLGTCLWIACGVGLILDLFSANSRFGLFSANYVLTTYMLYGQKRNFFEDSWSTLPFMTFVFSVLSTLVQILLLLVVDQHIIPLSLHFVFSDLIVMPLLDAVFAFCLFTLPHIFFGKPVRPGNDYFLSQGQE